MAKKPDWDYALRIKGVTLRTLPVALLADYLKELVGLMGEGSRPVLDGIVRGSVIVRVNQLRPGGDRRRRADCAV